MPIGNTGSIDRRNNPMSKHTTKNELTIAQLKSFQGFENISDEEAMEILVQLKEFSLMLYSVFLSTNNVNDN